LPFQQVGRATTHGRSKTQRNAINLTEKLHATLFTNIIQINLYFPTLLRMQHTTHCRLAVGTMDITH